MRNAPSRVLLGLSCLCVLAAAPAQAQVSALGKGWRLDGSGNLTPAAGEVISGSASIKGASSSSAPYNYFLESDPDYVHFAPSQTYTISVRYRILSAGPNGFQLGFFSAKGSAAGRYVPTTDFTGGAGSTGTATLTASLLNYDDYQMAFVVREAGTIVIDDIRVTDTAGRLVASENAEGPTIASGPLNLQVTDATSLSFEARSLLRSAVVHDLNGDGYSESVLTVSGPRPSTSPVPITIVESSSRLRLATPDFFPAGIPTTRHSPMTLFADLNGDGLRDIIFSEAGGDPFGDGRISVALNQGSGKFRDVSNLIPADQQNTRSYAVAVGDVLSDGRVSILLPDENDGANTALLRWNGEGFDEVRNWVPQSIWRGFPTSLRTQSWMNLADFDNDGKQDLLVSGSQSVANIRLVFGASDGFPTNGVVTLADGPWGHTPPPFPPIAQGAEVQPVVAADFNNDGLVDIFTTERKVVRYQAGLFNDTNDPDYPDVHANGGIINSDDTFQVLINQGSRSFVDRTAPNYVNLGNRTYFSLLPIDINNDGFLDVVGHYETGAYAGRGDRWGTTFFLNDGTGTFQVVDGAALIAVTTTPPWNEERWSFGAFLPTVVTPERTEGVVADEVSAGPAGGPMRVNLYKVVANGGIGTGPNFADSAALGVPGFNEFYYLGHYPDAADAVRAGQFRTGLDHYRAVGAGRGYQPHAPSSGIPEGVSLWSDNKTFRVAHQQDGNVVIYDANARAVWFTNTAGATGGVFVMQGDGNLVMKDAQGAVRWQSATSDNPGAYFGIQDDGNLVIFNAAGAPIWNALGR
jgi:hypothetical protein